MAAFRLTEGVIYGARRQRATAGVH